MPIPRKIRAAAVCGLLLAVSTGCGSTEEVSVGQRTANAVEKLAERESVTVTTRLSATVDEVHAFLKANHREGRGSAPTRADARVLAEAELTTVLGADKPLGELDRNDRLDSAGAMSFGGKDLLAYKSIGEKLYVRADLAELARQAGDSSRTLSDAGGLSEVADRLPPSLAAAREALAGRWVQIDPEEFDQFARVAGGKNGKRARKLTNAVAVLQDAGGQQHILGALGDTLDKDVSYRATGGKGDVEQIRVRLQAHEAARDLGTALAPVQRQFEGIGFSWLDKAPDRKIDTDLVLRDGTLSEMVVDLGQLGAQGSGKLPLKLFFAVGQAVPVKAPEGAGLLEPQDVLAVVLHRAMRAPEL